MPTVADVKLRASLSRAVRTARDIRAMARRGGRRRGAAPRLRFPCGHLEGQRAVNRRLRATERAVWIPCRSCNLITLLVARGGKSD